MPHRDTAKFAVSRFFSSFLSLKTDRFPFTQFTETSVMSTTKENYPEITMLRSFLLTAKTGSFTEAAKLMKVSQPAISTAIARLESFAGTPLFNRTARPIQLTPAGHHVRRRIEPIIEDLYSLSSEIKSFVSNCNARI